MTKHYLINIFIIVLIGGCLLKCQNKMHGDEKELSRIYFFDPRINQETTYYFMRDSAVIRVIDKYVPPTSSYSGHDHVILKTQLGDVESISLFLIGTSLSPVLFSVDPYVYTYALFESRGYLIQERFSFRDGDTLANPHNGIIEANLYGDTLKAVCLSAEGKLLKARAYVHSPNKLYRHTTFKAGTKKK